MAEIQNYQINYTIDVKTNGIQDVTKFSEAINKLKISEKGAEAAKWTLYLNQREEKEM